MSAVLARRAGIKRAYPVKGSVHISACVAVLLTAGLATAYADADGTSQFVGVSTFEKDNREGVDGALTVEVEHQEIAFANSGDINFGDVGSTVYFTDAATVSVDSNVNARPIAGTVTEIDGSLVWISPAIA